MALLLEIILPVFGLVLLGHLAAWRGSFPDSARDGLARFAFSFAIPALLFLSIANTELPPRLDWHFIASYYLGAVAVFVAGFVIARLVFGQDVITCGVVGFSSCYSNFALLGIPLLLVAFGEAASLPMFLLLSFHSLFLLPLMMIAGEVGRGSWDRIGEVPLVILRGMVTNPVFMALAAGLAWNLLSLPIPAAAESILRTLGQAAVPCALFAMGATLAQYGVSLATLRESLAVITLKMALHPLLVWLLASRVFEVSTEWQALAVVIAALPVGVTPYLMASRYRAGLDFVTTSMLLSTLASIGTITALLYLFEVR